MASHRIDFSNDSCLLPFGFPYSEANGSWIPPHEPLDSTGAKHLFQRVLERYIMTSICTFGFFGNILNLVVLTRAGYRKSEGMKENGAHIGLVALAVSDMLFCLAMFPRGFMEEKISLFLQYNFYIVYQLYGTGIITTLILTSTWITCTMALLRYIGICHPLRERNMMGLPSSSLSSHSCPLFLSRSVTLTMPPESYSSVRILSWSCSKSISRFFRRTL
jgi:hypothetical protein